MKGSRPLAQHEVAIVAKSFSTVRDKALFVLGVKTGFRISELLSLTVGDVWQHGAIVDRVTVQRCHMKKRLEGRTVTLHPEAKSALAAYLMARQRHGQLSPTEALFISRKGENRPISRVQAYRILQDAYDANGLQGQLGTHAMRKTFANGIYERLEHDLVKTQRALGHKNINSTVSYLSFREEDIDAAILAL